MDQGQVEFKNIRGLQKGVFWLTGLFLLSVLIGFHAHYTQLAVFEQIPFMTLENQEEIIAAAEFSDMYLLSVVVIRILLYIAIIITFCRFIYRASQNAHAATEINMDITPGWAVGWFFVPLANLWKPYQAVKEIFIVSHNPLTWTEDSRPLVLPLWWGAWIIANIIGNFVTRRTWSAETIPELTDATYMTVVSDIIEIPAVLLFLVVVKKLTDVQEAGPFKGRIVEVFS